jgi:hypothetical protein
MSGQTAGHAFLCGQASRSGPIGGLAVSVQNERFRLFAERLRAKRSAIATFFDFF